MHHPWRDFRDRWPEWQVCFTLLPDGVAGETDLETRTIFIDKRLNQAQRRSTITHEAIHVAQEDVDCTDRDEAAVEQAAARLLLPLCKLLHVLPWAGGLDEAADELWVDRDMLWCRLSHLHPAETAAIKRAFARRDNTD